LGALLFLIGCRCDSEVLRNHNWVLEQYGPTATPNTVLDPSTVTPPGSGVIRLTFSDGGRFGGGDGCNTLFGAYTLGSSCAIQFDSIGSTLMMCRPEIMQQAGDYTRILKAVRSYTIEGDLLELHSPSDEILLFRKE
jgi:heat shock protein HslJ